MVRALGSAVDCSTLVTPVDVAPIRSPQRVHSVIARHVQGKRVVEIGTRNGDGMCCMSQVASSAVAVELDAKYCDKLRARADALNSTGAHSFTVVCEDYRKARGLDADVFTWWQEPPHLGNPTVLTMLRGLQNDGQVRPDAEAILVFDEGWAEDMVDYAELQRLGWMMWTERVPNVNEFAECRERLKRSMYRKHWCA